MWIPITRLLVRLARRALNHTAHRLLAPYENVIWELPYDLEQTNQFLSSFYQAFDAHVMPQALTFLSADECYIITSFSKAHWEHVIPMLNTVVGVNRCFNVSPRYLIQHSLNDNSYLVSGRPTPMAIGEAYATVAAANQ